MNTEDRLLFPNGPLYWIICGVGFLLMFLYTIARKRHERIIAELETKRRNPELPSAETVSTE